MHQIHILIRISVVTMLLYSLDDHLIFFQIDDFDLFALDIHLDLRLILKLCGDFAHDSFRSPIHIALQIFDKFVDVSLLYVGPVLLLTVFLLEIFSRISLNGGLILIYCRG